MTKLRLRYQTIEFGKTDIHLCTLRDRQEFHDPEGHAKALGISSALWPLFGVVWPSALVLAHHLAEQDIASRRILEVGCGMALASLLLNKQGEDISATDCHPEVAGFLERNTALNGDPAIPFEQVDWSHETDSLGLFDLIIGSDLLYEDPQPELLASFIARHARPNCEVILVDPGRGRKNRLTTHMMDLGFDATHSKADNTDYLDETFKGHVMYFRREA